MYKLLKIFCWCLIFFHFSVDSACSQDRFKKNALNQDRADKLSDTDVTKFQEQVKSSGIDENIIKTNIVNTKIFGAELFSTPSLSFQSDLQIATPVNYQLGPRDVLQISVHGLQEASFNLKVTPEGNIDIPNVGEIKVSGYTIEEARNRIRSSMSSIYTSLRNNSSQLSINLGGIRSISIIILGSARPGTFQVSSLSTVFNALYLSGGPGLNGSYREIELLRNNKIVKKIDLYKVLLTGSLEDNIRLYENDIIRIPVYKTRVDIEGEVKRPGIFEMLTGESLTDLLHFASGFSDSAYRASVKVIQLTDKERKVKDLSSSDFSQYKPSTGDYFEVSKILNRFQNRVSIEGAVFRPGIFELSSNLSLGQLIRKADGIREDAYTKRGLLIRLKENLEPQSIPFDVAAVLNNKNDIPLKREDKIIIASIFDLQDLAQIHIQGEVRKPGTFNFTYNLTLQDLIFQAGGFTFGAYPQRIEIARIIKRDTLTAGDQRTGEIIDIKDINDLSLTDKNIFLQPGDIVTVRRLPGLLELRSVTATGQVQYPGPYVLENRAERISDLLRRAGGFAPEAYPNGAYLQRQKEKSFSTDIKTLQVEKKQLLLKDSTEQITTSVDRPYDIIPLDLVEINSHPGIDEDLILKPDDILFVPRNDEQIKISGEVAFPTQLPFKSGKNLKDYISDAGGFSDDARKKKVYILYPNGKAASTHHFLFVRTYPQIKPGAEIIVPKVIERVRARRNPAETVALTSALASLTYLIILIVRNL